MSIPLVSIVCLAYNHESYIRQCLDGFVMQKTKFKIEVLISDDASTDNTAKIIKEYEQRYPDLFVTFYHKKNLYSQHIDFFFTEFMPNAKGKYIAMCEGDDYWTDPLKLQKQVDFLEGHEEYSMSMHNTSVFYQKENYFKERPLPPLLKGENYGFTFTNKDRIKDWFGGTLTCVFRKSALPNENIYKLYTEFVDMHLFYYILKKGKGYFFKDNMAVYRRANGVWAKLDKNSQQKKNALWFGELYDNEKHNVIVTKMLQQNIYNTIISCKSFSKILYFVKEYGNVAIIPILRAIISVPKRLLMHFFK